MYAADIVGEESLGQPASTTSIWDSLGDISKTLLSTGSNIYALQTQKNISQLQLETARVSSASAIPSSTILQPSGAAILQQPRSNFPVIPVVAGVGALGILFLVLSKKKGRR